MAFNNIAFVIFFLLQLSFLDCYNPIVKIPNGSIRGVVLQDYDEETFYGFKSIPYAKPPIGENRFRTAVKNDPWQGIIDGTIDAPMCLQPNFDQTSEIGTEDCLYLNVFTPSTNPACLKPVMVYIHSGRFILGASKDYGAGYLMPQDIVLVTMNYRLGVYGFINLVNSNYPCIEEEIVSNNGFRDQTLALQWVQENIKYFGGDPKQVTIVGPSSSGECVHAHMLSPLSKGLFQGAIPMSGSTLHPWSYAPNDTAIPLAEYLNIDTSNHKTMIQELKKVSHDEIFQAIKALDWFKIQIDRPSLPTLAIEKPGPNSFMPDYPINLIKSRNYNKVPMMIGITNMEGLFFLALGEDTTDIRIHIPFFFHNPEEAGEKMISFYELSPNAILNNITFWGDLYFRYNTFRTVYGHAESDKQNNMYLYEFSADTRLNFYKPNLLPNVGIPGAIHGDDIGYLFIANSVPLAEKGSIEENLMRLMTKIYGNFVKTGNPYCGWKPFTTNNYNYINITNSGLKSGIVDMKPINFWQDIYDTYSDGLH